MNLRTIAYAVLAAPTVQYVYSTNARFVSVYSSNEDFRIIINDQPAVEVGAGVTLIAPPDDFISRIEVLPKSGSVITNNVKLLVGDGQFVDGRNANAGTTNIQEVNPVKVEGINPYGNLVAASAQVTAAADTNFLVTAGNAAWKRVRVYNEGTTVLRLAQNSGTLTGSTSGIPVKAGDFIELPFVGALYGRAVGAAAAVAFLYFQ